MNLKGEPAYVGRHCGSNTCSVTPELVAFYGEALDDRSPLYDELAERLQRKIFQREAELGIGTVFWYHMIRWIDQMANYADRVGSRLRLLIAR